MDISPVFTDHHCSQLCHVSETDRLGPSVRPVLFLQPRHRTSASVLLTRVVSERKEALGVTFSFSSLRKQRHPAS